jgi:hypothetical protein
MCLGEQFGSTGELEERFPMLIMGVGAQPFPQPARTLAEPAGCLLNVEYWGWHAN